MGRCGCIPRHRGDTALLRKPLAGKDRDAAPTSPPSRRRSPGPRLPPAQPTALPAAENARRAWPWGLLPPQNQPKPPHRQLFPAQPRLPLRGCGSPPSPNLLPASPCRCRFSPSRPARDSCTQLIRESPRGGSAHGRICAGDAMASGTPGRPAPAGATSHVVCPPEPSPSRGSRWPRTDVFAKRLCQPEAPRRAQYWQEGFDSRWS